MSTQPRSRKLGVIGTLVWDRICGPDASGVVEDWGGLAYALVALEATLDPNWGVVPIVKVGKDLTEGAMELVDSLESVVDTEAVHPVAEDNNRVELTYSGPSRRVEALSGGVPPWTWSELEPYLAGLDGLYVNFISGFEFPLDVARQIRQAFDRPTYADLHSLFLGVDGSGRRFHRPLVDALEWCRAFDAVQVNEDELRQLATGRADPWAWAVESLDLGVGEILVTLAGEGAAHVGYREDDRAEILRVPVGPTGGGDPTGCGDVWGATFFGSRLAGTNLLPAMERANRVAGINLQSRGVTGFRDGVGIVQRGLR